MHEPYDTLSSAKVRLEEIKQLYLDNCSVLNYKTLDSIPPPPMPAKFGTDNGTIPVEIM